MNGSTSSAVANMQLGVDIFMHISGLNYCEPECTAITPCNAHTHTDQSTRVGLPVEPYNNVPFFNINFKQ